MREKVVFSFIIIAIICFNEIKFILIGYTFNQVHKIACDANGREKKKRIEHYFFRYEYVCNGICIRKHLRMEKYSVQAER